MPPRGPRRGTHGQQPPPWWPEGEPWPPRGQGGEGRRLGRRFAALLVIIFLLVWVAFWVANHAWGDRGSWQDNNEGPPGPFFWPPFALLAISIGVFLLVRKLGRTFRPLADMIDAANRVATGDYSVRVDATGKGPPEVSRMVDAFNTMTTRLEANEIQRKHLLSDIAHELRTPLAVVSGTIEGMIDDVYPRDNAHLAPLLDQTRQITRLLEDLQTVATAEAGALALHRLETDAGELIEEVAAAFAPLGSRQGVSVSAAAPGGIEVDVDPMRIRQVLDNLVTNALRYTEPGGRVTIGLRREGGTAVITVRDTGRGMTHEDARRMFERFVKSADSGGSGLGLAIARGLVEAHGGTIAATSEPGEGTIVTIRLPALPAS